MYRGCVFCKMRDALLGCMGGSPQKSTEELSSSAGDYSERIRLCSLQQKEKERLQKQQRQHRPKQQPRQFSQLSEQYSRLTPHQSRLTRDPSQSVSHQSRLISDPTRLTPRQSKLEPPKTGKLGIQSRYGYKGQSHQAKISQGQGQTCQAQVYQGQSSQAQVYIGQSSQRQTQRPKRKSPEQQLLIEPRSKGTQLPRPSTSKQRSRSKPRSQECCYSDDEGHIKAHYCKLFEKQYKRDLVKREAGRLPLLEYSYENNKPIRGILKKREFVRTPRMEELIYVEETERSKEAFMDMLATRYPQYAEKISSTASDDGFPVRGRSRDPQRRATVAYNPQHNRSLDYEGGAMSDVDSSTFHRGGFVRSSLPATRSPTSTDKPAGLVFLIFRDETKKALLPNEITHLDTVRALFVRSFPGKLTMSFLESPKRKIYILDPRTNIYYQIEDLRDIKDRTVLRVHECDSLEPQRVVDKPEVRGRTIHIPPGSQSGFYGATPSSAITSQVQKSHTLPAHMEQPVYMSHEDVTQSPVRTSYERSRSLTPDPSRSSTYAQNPIYGRMGISPERPPPPQERVGPPDRPPTLRTIPENYLMLNGNNGNRNGYVEFVNGMPYQHQGSGVTGVVAPGMAQRVSGHQRQAMSPPAVPTGPRVDIGRRAFSPPPNLQNYDYIQVVPSSHITPTTSTYMAKGVRANTLVTPQRATGAPHMSPGLHPQQSPGLHPQPSTGLHHQPSPGLHTQPSTGLHPQPSPGHHIQPSPGLHPQPSPGQQLPGQHLPGQQPSGQQHKPRGQHQQSWRERSPVGRHSLALSTVPYGTGPSPGQQSYQRSQSYRVPPTSERDASLVPRPRSITPSQLEPDTTRVRIDKMEHQLASLAAWVQTAVIQSSEAPSSVKSTSSNSVTSDTSPNLDSASSKLDDEQMENAEIQGLTDIASVGTATLSQDMKNNILSIKNQADALRHDLRSLRRLQQINKESILETVDDAWRKIREALSSVPGAENLLIRQQRNEIDVMYKIYLEDKANADKELIDLEHAVEELRSDVLSRQCRVQMSDVEGMALVLSHVTKALGDLKVRFPQLQDRLKFVMAAEMELIVNEEKFLKEEPERLDNSLKKCKKLTGTLFTLKRLASVQEHRPPQPVAMTAHAHIPTLDDHKAVLENIQAMIPDHEARVQGIQAAETSRERKKKITTQQEALRFGKSLEMASKALKSAVHTGAAPPLRSHPGGTTTAGRSSIVDIPTTSTPKSSMSDTSSVISFAMPMSTSTPKGSSQPPTSYPDTSSTSPSISYPVMSLIKSVSPRDNTISGQGQADDTKVKGHYIDRIQGHDQGQKVHASKSARSEPAVLPVTSVTTETKGQKVVSKPSTEKLNTQKSSARAAFFSSLSSPTTPTTSTSPLTITSAPSTESPTEGSTRRITTPGSLQSSPVRAIPSLIRSSAVTSPTGLPGQSVSQSHSHSVAKPSSLLVSSSSSGSTGSMVSTQKFSPVSPANGAGVHSSTGSKPRTTFTAIPKPYSPTKSTPSPLTPESPKYRIPPSQMSSDGGVTKKQVTIISQTRDPAAKPKKIPPPPPPRKSSRVPGHAVLAVNAATANGQLMPAKQNGSKQTAKPQSSKSTTGIKGRADVIDPPKQFANLPLDTKVERKSSIGSLKQFTTPLLESKRDIQHKEKDKQFKQSGLVPKKISDSNLDTKEKEPKKNVKDIDLPLETSLASQSEVSMSTRKIIDGKVTNISAEKENVEEKIKESSIESSGSSSSIDSQQEVIWHKQKDDSSEASSSVTKNISDLTDQSTASISSSKTSEQDGGKSMTESVGGKKPKPPPPERRSSLSSRPVTEDSSQDTDNEKKEKTEKKETKGSIDRLV